MNEAVSESSCFFFCWFFLAAVTCGPEGGTVHSVVTISALCASSRKKEPISLLRLGRIGSRGERLPEDFEWPPLFI